MRIPRPMPLVAPALAVLGLTSFAVAQPALDLLGDNAEFFVAHGMSGGETVRFALSVYLIPPLVIGSVIGVIGLVNRAAGRWALSVAGGVLTATAVVQLLPEGVRARTVLYLGVFVVAAVGAGWAFQTTSVMARFWRIMGAISPAVLLSFLFLSSAGDIVFADEVDIVGVGARTDDDVVFVVLDEFSLATILDGDGDLDSAKVPNLARLASTATFYADATTVSPETARSLPSILSGQIAEPGQLPLASEFPQNLFTLLAPSHELVVDEIVTQMCPPAACADAATGDSSVTQLYDDARVVYLHAVLPTRWADSWLPDITNQWTGFGDALVEDQPADEPSYIAVQEEVADDQAARAQAFIERLALPSDRPRLDYVHLAVPHIPFTYLPDGRRYNGSRLDGLADGEWSEDGTETDLADFRYQLQVAYVDGLIGSMLDSLESSGRFDQSMIVVVSDHGAAHRPGLPRRIPTVDTLGDLAWVPLVVKYPDQREGDLVHDAAQTIDVLPTVADALGIRLAEPVDGRSLLDAAPAPTRRLVGHPEWDLDVDADLDEAIARIHRTLPAGTPAAKGYGLDELQGRTGLPVGTIAEPSPVPDPADAILTPDRLDLLTAVDTAGPFVPSLFRAGVSGLAPGDHVALFLGDRLAGSGRVSAEGNRLVAMLDPAAMTDGLNVVTAMVVRADGRFQPVPVDRTVVELEVDNGSIRAVVGEERRWDTAVDHPAALDVRPGDDIGPGGNALVAGWVARCGGGEPAAEQLVLVVDGEAIPLTFERIERPDIPCLDGPAPVVFSVRVAFDLVDAGADVTIVALFDDGTFAVLK